MAAVCGEEAADTFHDMDLHLVWNGTELEETSSSVVGSNEVDILDEEPSHENTLINETATLDNVELDMKVKVNDEDLQAKADYQVYKTDNNITATLTLNETKDDGEECCVDDVTADQNPNALLEACIKVDKVEKTGTNVSMHMEWHTQTAKDVEAMLRFSNNNHQPKRLKNHNNDEKIEAVIKMNDNNNNDNNDSSHSYLKSKESFSDMILNEKIAPYLNDYVDINIKGKKRKKKKSENKYLDMCKRSYVDANKIKKIKIIQYKIKRKQNYDEENSVNLSASIEKIIEADLQTRIPHGTNKILTNTGGDTSSMPKNSGEDGVDGGNHNLTSSDDDSFQFIRSEETKALILQSGNTEEGEMYSGKIFTKEVVASNSSFDKNCNMKVDVERSVEFQIISVEKYDTKIEELNDTKIEELKEDSCEKGLNAEIEGVTKAVDIPVNVEDEDIERNKVIIERVYETQIKSEIHLCEETMSQSVDNDEEINMLDNSFHTTSDEKEKSADFQIISVEKCEADFKEEYSEDKESIIEEESVITPVLVDLQLATNEDEDIERNKVVIERVFETHEKAEIDICDSTSTNHSDLEINENEQHEYNTFEGNLHTISEDKEKSAEFHIISVEKCDLETKEESSCEENLEEEEEESVITPLLADVQMAVNEDNFESNQILVQRVFDSHEKSEIDICDINSTSTSIHEISEKEQEEYNTFKEIFHTTSDEKEKSTEFQIISVEKSLAEVEADTADSCEENLDVVEENVITANLVDVQMAVNKDEDIGRNEVVIERVFETHERAEIDLCDSFSTNSSIHEISFDAQQEYNTFEENFHTTSEEKEKSVEFQIISVDKCDLEVEEDVSCELKLQVEEDIVITPKIVDVQMAVNEDENIERNQVLVQRVFETQQKSEIEICDSTSTISVNEQHEHNIFEENFHATSEEKEKSVEFQVISVGECDTEVEGDGEYSYEKELSTEEEVAITANLVDEQMAVNEENTERNTILVQRVFETHEKPEIDFSHSLSESLSIPDVNENSYQEFTMLEGHLDMSLDKDCEDEKCDGKEEEASSEIKLENAVIDLEVKSDYHASFVETTESFVHLNEEPLDEPTDVVEEVEEDIIVEQIEDDVMCELVNSEIYEHSLFSSLEYHEDLVEENMLDIHNQYDDHVSSDGKIGHLSNSNNDFVHSDIEEIKSIEKNCIEINRYASPDEKDLTISREENGELTFDINMKRNSIRKNLIVIPMANDDNHVSRNVILVHRLLDAPEKCLKDESIMTQSSIQTATDYILDESKEQDGSRVRLDFNNDIITENVMIGSQNDYDSSFDSVYDEGEINVITTIHEDIVFNSPKNAVIDLHHEDRNHVEIMRMNNERRNYEEESSIKSYGLSASIDEINSRNLIIDEQHQGEVDIENIDLQHQGEFSIESIDKQHREEVGMTSYITCTYIEYEEYFLKSNETYVMNKDEMEIYDFLEAFKTGFVILNVDDDKPPLEVGYSTIEAKYLRNN